MLSEYYEVSAYLFVLSSEITFFDVLRLYSIRILKLKKSYYPNFCLGSQLVLKKTFTERLAWLSVAETKGGPFSHA